MRLHVVYVHFGRLVLENSLQILHAHRLKGRELQEDQVLDLTVLQHEALVSVWNVSTLQLNTFTYCLPG